ncbi:MAG: hypothetical protein U9N62_10625 [Thermotogota bacterium]|nr:hypothetical protein [Thermotogota bacterium]
MEKGEKKVQVILFLILVMGVLFLGKAFFLRYDYLFTDQHRTKTLASTSNPQDQMIVSNVFFDHWDPVYSFIQSYQPEGFLLDDVQNEGDYYTLKISRRKAAYYVELEEIGRMLFSENGEIVWNIPDRGTLNSKYYSLPEIYGVGEIQQVKEIIARISKQPAIFKNYLSTVDAEEKIFYFRNGNVLLVNSWSNLDVFNGEEFIYQMGKGQIYDLYSNGRYFPIIKRGE